MSRGIEACAAALRQRFGADIACDVVSVDGDPSGLWPGELEFVARAVPARQREFAAGRACARALLARLGCAPAALLRAHDRSPLWPNGTLGSIAHDAHRCAVAVARSGPLTALGLDIEPDEPLEEDLWPELFLARELAQLAACSPDARGRVARGLFSAKECVFKATHALVRTSLGFRDVEIVFAAGSERFGARLQRSAGAEVRAVLEGFQLRCAGSILTGMSVVAAPAPRRTLRRRLFLDRTRPVHRKVVRR